MTAQAQSLERPNARPASPWRHAFLLGMRQNAVVTAVATLAFLLLYTALPAAVLITGNTRPGEPYPAYKYLFFVGYASYAQQLYPWLTVVSVFLQGVLAFRFLYSPKSSIAWYSLGLSRSDVFWSRFTSGALGALLPVVVSLSATFGFNLAFSPDIGLVLARYAFFLTGLCVQILVLYSITAAVCSYAATAVEAAASSFALCLLPSVLISFSNILMHRLLFGTPYHMAGYYPFELDYVLIRMLSNWNPLLFMSPYMALFGGETESVDAYAKFFSLIQPNSFNWLVPLGWALAAMAVIWLARWLFLRRKAEIAGRVGAGRTLGALCVLTSGLAAFGGVYLLPLYLPRYSLTATWVPLISAASAALAAMFAVALPMRMFARPRWKGFAAVFGGLAAMAALAGILVTGGLGYSARVPDAAEVKSVKVSYIGLNHYVQESEVIQSGFFSQEFAFSPCVTLTDRADIEMVTSIHRKLIGAGKLDTHVYAAGSPRIYDATIRIRYTLGNGAILARTYRGLAQDMVKSVLTLDDTAGVKQAYVDSLLHPQEDSVDDQFTAYMNGSIYLCSPLYSAVSSLDLAADARKEFIQCISDDLAAQPSSDRYLPDRPPVCLIEFVLLNRSSKPGYPGDNKTVYVTRRFVRTLAFLAAHAITVPEEKTVERLCIVHEAHYLPIFKSEMERVEYVDGYGSFEPVFWLKMSDDRLKTILPVCRCLCLDSEDGYTVYIKFEGQKDFITSFLPTSDAPDYVTEALN